MSKSANSTIQENQIQQNNTAHPSSIASVTYGTIQAPKLFAGMSSVTMLKKAKLIMAASLAIVVTVGMCACAQTTNGQNRMPLPQRPGRQGQMNQRQNVNPNQARRPGARLMSVQAMLLPPMKARIMQMAKRIALTDGQQTQLTDLSSRFYARMTPVLKTRAQGIQQVRRVMISRNITASALSAAASKVEKADRILLDAEISFWTDFHNVLTPGQQAQFDQSNSSMGGGQQPATRRGRRMRSGNGARRGLGNAGAAGNPNPAFGR